MLTINCKVVPQSCPEIFGDLWVLDVDNMTWTNLSSLSFGNPPSARYCHGLTANNGKLFVHGGSSENGMFQSMASSVENRFKSWAY